MVDEPSEGAPTDSDAEFRSAGEIGRRAGRGGLLLLVRTAGLQALQVASAIVLARTIVPADYGAFALAATFVGFARLAGDLGVMQSLIVRPTITRGDLAASALIALVVAAVLGALVATVVGIGVDAVLRGDTQARILTWALAPVLLLDALRLPPIIRLHRRLEFGRIGLATIAETVALYVAQLILLLLGLDVWALLLAQYARAIAGVAAYARLGDGLVAPRWTPDIRAIVTRSLPFQGPSLLTALGGLIFPVLVGYRLGSRGLGLWAWSTVLAAPLTQVLHIVQTVAMPSLARVQTRFEDRFMEAADLSARVTAMIAALGAGSLIGLVPEVVPVVFDERWSGAIGAVQVSLVGLLPLALVQHLSSTLDARDRARARLVGSVLAMAAALASIYPLMISYGVAGAALASAVVGPAVDAAVLAWIARVPLGRATIDAASVMTVATAASFFFAGFAAGVIGLAGAAAGAMVLGLIVAVLVDRHAVMRMRRLAFGSS